MIERSRAGFWRRHLSLFIDALVVFLPFQAMAALLFGLTAGMVQFASGITYITCAPVTHLPNNLQPAPPAGANSAKDCHVFFFGAETARLLSVSRMTKEGSTTKVVTQTYMLNKQGDPVSGVSLQWPAFAALLVYLVLLKAQWGSTLGDRATSICLILTTSDSTLCPSVRTLMLRYLVFLSPLALIVVTQLYFLSTAGGGADQLAAGSFLISSLVAAVPAVFLYLVAVVQVVRKRDPWYDRIAKIAVVRR